MKHVSRMKLMKRYILINFILCFMQNSLNYIDFNSVFKQVISRCKLFCLSCIPCMLLNAHVMHHLDASGTLTTKQMIYEARTQFWPHGYGHGYDTSTHQFLKSRI